ncbi:MAG: radical SAM protein [Paracoccaceae bacterium]
MTNIEQVVPHWYMYPPKSAYLPSGPTNYGDLWDQVPTEMCFYVHIPFCNMKCSFCSLFTSSGYSEDSAERYVEHLLKEISSSLRLLQNEEVTVPSLYFGGGTPGLLDRQSVDSICSAISADPRITIQSRSVEFSPDIVDAERMDIWLNNSFDRISIGVQTFSDTRLSVMGRKHSLQEALSAIEQAARSGFSDINVDLIFGHEDQTIIDWAHDLLSVTGSDATSCTFHPLATVEKTPFERKPSNQAADFGLLRELQGQAYEHFSRHGWERTSAISYSKIGRTNPLEAAEARGASTFGFGAGSRSYLPSIHISTVPVEARAPFGGVLKSYYDCVEAGQKPTLAAVEPNPEEELRRSLILQLHHGNVTIPQDKAEVDSSTLKTVKIFFEELEQRGLVRKHSDTYVVTDKGALSAARIGSDLASLDVRGSLQERMLGSVESSLEAHR